MDLFGDLFGNQSEKERKRQQGYRNQRKGAAAEEQVKMEYAMNGYEIEDVHEGADFIARRRDPFTGRVEKTEKVEVKSGGASLTERQRQEKRNSRNYTVERRENSLFDW
jgi:hypothetical protein